MSGEVAALEAEVKEYRLQASLRWGRYGKRPVMLTWFFAAGNSPNRSTKRSG